MINHSDIRIGTLVGGGAATADYIRQILPHGFESFQITFWQTIGQTDLARLADEVNDALTGSSAVISSLGIFGNPLMDTPEAELCRKHWADCIDAAPLFGADIVAGFTGRVVGKSIPDSMKRYAEVFKPLARRAADRGVRIAFENCDMGGNWNSGDWNIAHNPSAWELMFNALPDENVGLEWEPCHQMMQLIDPIPQIRKWGKKFFHLHGKDGTVHHHIIREFGIGGAVPYKFHRTPGFGDTNWTDVISELRMIGFKGSIDIEGWHDCVYREDLEMTGQVHALNYLKHCRGGPFVPNPITAK